MLVIRWLVLIPTLTMFLFGQIMQTPFDFGASSRQPCGMCLSMSDDAGGSGRGLVAKDTDAGGCPLCDDGSVANGKQSRDMMHNGPGGSMPACDEQSSCLPGAHGHDCCCGCPCAGVLCQPTVILGHALRLGDCPSQLVQRLTNDAVEARSIDPAIPPPRLLA